MHIGLVSYEFPPETAFGGIGTYTYQAAMSLQKAGCKVDVFTASHNRQILNEETEFGIRVHRLKALTREIFRDQVAIVIKDKHEEDPFDVLESPEYGAEGYFIKDYLPYVPLVVKLHTPHFYIRELNNYLQKNSLKNRLKRLLNIGIYKKEKDNEYQLALKADLLVSPSISLQYLVAERWEIGLDKIVHLPYPFIPTADLLSVPIETKTNTITFFGRLEVRKGVHLFVSIIPKVLQELPGVKFRFIGKTNKDAKGGGTMLAYLKKNLKAYRHQIEYIDHVSIKDIPLWMKQTDICAFPSIWENFPNVCLEAMSAGRGIIASKHGGMKDMLEKIDGGLLINPFDTTETANKIIYLMKNPDIRFEMAKRSRQKIISYYGEEIVRQQIECYKDLIQKKK